MHSKISMPSSGGQNYYVPPPSNTTGVYLPPGSNPGVVQSAGLVGSTRGLVGSTSLGGGGSESESMLQKRESRKFHINDPKPSLWQWERNITYEATGKPSALFSRNSLYTFLIVFFLRKKLDELRVIKADLLKLRMLKLVESQSSMVVGKSASFISCRTSSHATPVLMKILGKYPWVSGVLENVCRGIILVTMIKFFDNFVLKRLAHWMYWFRKIRWLFISSSIGNLDLIMNFLHIPILNSIRPRFFRDGWGDLKLYSIAQDSIVNFIRGKDGKGKSLPDSVSAFKIVQRLGSSVYHGGKSSEALVQMRHEGSKSTDHINSSSNESLISLTRGHTSGVGLFQIDEVDGQYDDTNFMVGRISDQTGRKAGRITDQSGYGIPKNNVCVSSPIISPLNSSDLSASPAFANDQSSESPSYSPSPDSSPGSSPAAGVNVARGIRWGGDRHGKSSKEANRNKTANAKKKKFLITDVIVDATGPGNSGASCGKSERFLTYDEFPDNTSERGSNKSTEESSRGGSRSNSPDDSTRKPIRRPCRDKPNCEILCRSKEKAEDGVISSSKKKDDKSNNGNLSKDGISLSSNTAQRNATSSILKNTSSPDSSPTHKVEERFSVVGEERSSFVGEGSRSSGGKIYTTRNSNQSGRGSSGVPNCNLNCESTASMLLERMGPTMNPLLQLRKGAPKMPNSSGRGRFRKDTGGSRNKNSTCSTSTTSNKQSAGSSNDASSSSSTPNKKIGGNRNASPNSKAPTSSPPTPDSPNSKGPEFFKLPDLHWNKSIYRVGDDAWCRQGRYRSPLSHLFKEDENMMMHFCIVSPSVAFLHHIKRKTLRNHLVKTPNYKKDQEKGDGPWYQLGVEERLAYSINSFLNIGCKITGSCNDVVRLFSSNCSPGKSITKRGASKTTVNEKPTNLNDNTFPNVLVVDFPGTGEQMYTLPLMLAAKNAKEKNYISLLITAPHYGRRKPWKQYLHYVREVGAMLLATPALQAETVVLSRIVAGLIGDVHIEIGRSARLVRKNARIVRTSNTAINQGNDETGNQENGEVVVDSYRPAKVIICGTGFSWGGGMGAIYSIIMSQLIRELYEAWNRELDNARTLAKFSQSSSENLNFSHTFSHFDGGTLSENVVNHFSGSNLAMRLEKGEFSPERRDYSGLNPSYHAATSSTNGLSIASPEVTYHVCAAPYGGCGTAAVLCEGLLGSDCDWHSLHATEIDMSASNSFLLSNGFILNKDDEGMIRSSPLGRTPSGTSIVAAGGGNIALGGGGGPGGSSVMANVSLNFGLTQRGSAIRSGYLERSLQQLGPDISIDCRRLVVSKVPGECQDALWRFLSTKGLEHGLPFLESNVEKRLLTNATCMSFYHDKFVRRSYSEALFRVVGQRICVGSRFDARDYYKSESLNRGGRSCISSGSFSMPHSGSFTLGRVSSTGGLQSQGVLLQSQGSNGNFVPLTSKESSLGSSPTSVQGNARMLWCVGGHLWALLCKTSHQKRGIQDAVTECERIMGEEF